MNEMVPKDIETYLSAKEYVDTAVIPLYSIIIWGGNETICFNAEFITLLTNLSGKAIYG